MDADICPSPKLLNPSNLDPATAGYNSALGWDSLPFHKLHSHDLREDIYCLPRIRENRRLVTGNCLSTSTLRDLRSDPRNKVPPCFRYLGGFFDLPVELILETFKNLHPIDLYTLIRVTKSLRNLLLNHRSSRIWKEAFARYPDIPSCPPILSYPKWTSLLFGPDACDTCGFGRSLVDFASNLRRCEECMEREYIYPGDEFNFCSPLLQEEPESNPWKLLVRTNRCIGSYFPEPPDWMYFDDSARYLSSDVQERVREVKPFVKAMEQGMPSAKENYRQFFSKVSQEVRDTEDRVRKCNEWAADIQRDLYERHERALPGIVKKWTRLIIAEGKDPRDVAYAQGSILNELAFHCALKPTLSVFRAYLPRLFDLVEMARMGRLVAEHQETIRSRRARVSAFYEKVRAEQDPRTWAEQPIIERYLELSSAASQYIQSDLPLDEPPLPGDDMEAEILQYFDTWTTCSRQQVLRTLSKISHFASKINQSDFDVLNLATTVFICPRHHILPGEAGSSSAFALVGWEDLRYHLNCLLHWSPDNFQNEVAYACTFQFTFEGYQTACRIIRLSGLDPHSATIKDMDQLNDRYICLNCRETTGHDSPGHFVMTWKESISHSLELEKMPGHQYSSLVLLSQKATRAVTLREPLHPPPTMPQWSCTHCSAHFLAAEDLSEVKTHLLSCHEISRPAASVDYFFRWENVPACPRQLHFLKEDATLTCRHCPYPEELQLWVKHDLFKHLLDKHKIEHPIKDNDWTEVDLLDERREIKYPVKDEDCMEIDLPDEHKIEYPIEDDDWMEADLVNGIPS